MTRQWVLMPCVLHDEAVKALSHKLVQSLVTFSFDTSCPTHRFLTLNRRMYMNRYASHYVRTGFKLKASCKHSRKRWNHPRRKPVENQVCSASQTIVAVDLISPNYRVHSGGGCVELSQH